MEQKERMYKRSNGEVVKMSSMNTEHIINSLSKKYREVFESKNKDDFTTKTNEINDLKEELYSRFNTFNEGLGENKWLKKNYKKSKKKGNLDHIK